MTLRRVMQRGFAATAPANPRYDVQALVQQAERVDRVVHVVDAAEVRAYGQAEERT